MIDNDERLLQQFFSEAANQKIEDNGFTERVMQQLASANVQCSTFNVQRSSFFEAVDDFLRFRLRSTICGVPWLGVAGRSV